jgi:hypothetical protein
MRYQVTTHLPAPEALGRAIGYFGPGGLGLAVISQTPHAVIFQGRGGYVAVTARTGAATTLELETREWDLAVRKFMGKISRRRYWLWRLWYRKKRPPSPPSFTMLNNGNRRR